MLRVCIRALVLGILSTAFAGAQQPPIEPSTTPPATLKFENGSIANGVYSNECFGFSLPIPDGWEVSPVFGAGGKARHIPGQLMLLSIFHEKDKSSHYGLSLSARRATDDSASTRDIISSSVHSFLKSHPEGREIIRNAFAVSYGGKTLFRADAKTLMSNNVTSYNAFIGIKFRGYVISGFATANSSEELDLAVDALRGITFQEDQIDSRCYMGEDDPMGGGITLSKPAQPQPGQRVRISRSVAAGLLTGRVNPDYPAEARAQHTEGQVVLHAFIDEKGSVKDLSVISGDPLLAPPALTAVKQWKYKPYLLNGQPVNVETEVVLDFALPKP